MYLYRYEIKGIQRFIFRSSKLRDVAAASNLIDSGLDGPLVTLLSDGRIEMQAAGSATLSFKSLDAARTFAEEWPMKVHEVLPGVEMIAALIPETDLDRLHERLQESRNAPLPHAYDAGPLVARSARTGGAAIGREHGMLIDARHVALKQCVKSRALEEKLLQGPDLLGHTFLTDAEDFSLGSHRYLALVHADGNGIGKRVIELLEAKDIKAFAAFSKALKETTLTAVQKAILDVRNADPVAFGEEVLPMRPIVVGGDDVTILLRSQDALRFTENYLRYFEEGCRQHTDLPGFTASAAIVYAKIKAPFYAVHDVCEELCSWVKNTTQREYSALAIHRITESPFESYALTQARSLSLDGLKNGLCGGPYLVQRSKSKHGFPIVEMLRDVSKQVAELPRTPIREWMRVRQEDAERGKLRWQRIGEIQTDDKAWKVLNDFLECGHWQKYTHKCKSSPLLDAITLNFAERRIRS